MVTSNTDDIIISTIVPLYKGKKYVHRLIDICKKAYIKAGVIDASELIFVNDFPGETIEPPEEKFVKLLHNRNNMGIHKSRVNGVINAKGKWIHFLDQDDSIQEDFYHSQLDFEKNADVIIANAIIKDCGYDRVLYRSVLERMIATHGWFYIELDNRIISPGQCLVNKKKIPENWLRHCMTVNGADDLLLWLFMFDEQCKYVVNPNALYTHEYTGKNLSSNTENMTKSMNELYDIYKDNSVNGKYTRQLQKKIKFLNGDYHSFDGKMRQITLAIRKNVVKAAEVKHGDKENG